MIPIVIFRDTVRGLFSACHANLFLVIFARGNVTFCLAIIVGFHVIVAPCVATAFIIIKVACCYVANCVTYLIIEQLRITSSCAEVTVPIIIVAVGIITIIITSAIPFLRVYTALRTRASIIISPTGLLIAVLIAVGVVLL